MGTDLFSIDAHIHQYVRCPPVNWTSTSRARVILGELTLCLLLAALSLRLVRLRPSITAWSSVLPACVTVSRVLEDYPYRNFSLLIKELLKLAPPLSGLASPSRRPSMSTDKHQSTNADTESHHGRSNGQGSLGGFLEQHSVPHRKEISVDGSAQVSAPQRVAPSTDSLIPDVQEGWWNTLLPLEPHQDWEEPTSAVFDWGLDYNTFAESIGMSGNSNFLD